ncbi:hypothetical protein [Allobranchiibius huperziae]|uniref:Uncharacterized protein n=1 Tax=Allobranchiibius huperziae TaxID=1874116 RepID=A0A853DAR2_9MICO|nr:hypothetical protein [Allobranchiibius huperziae]NYJ73079.1 hypothetical protein [Allobranchiibius huperziae]
MIFIEPGGKGMAVPQPLRAAGIIGSCALVCSGSIALATPASAANASNFYIHGSTHLAAFQSYSACAPHARWELAQVNATPGAAPLSAQYMPNGELGTDALHLCYPTSDGRWSYVIAYTATKPINKLDRLVNTAARIKAIETSNDTSTQFDSENVKLYVHRVPEPTSVSVAQCDKAQQNVLNKVIASPHLRLVRYSSKGCNSNGDHGYFVAYLSDGRVPALYRDTLWRSRAYMVDTMGYEYSTTFSAGG